MKETHLAIGDLGRLTGTKVETVRYYVRIGLLAARRAEIGPRTTQMDRCQRS
jgi:DNA-binding transcriptional MerR regulator